MTLFNKINFLLIGIIILGFLIRIFKIDVSPQGLYVDETSIGYNAYSLITTGRDEHGKFMPIFFEAFGEYKLPVYIYLVAATQLILGPSDLSVRLPSVVFGTLTILVTYLFARELLKNSPNEMIKKMVPFLSAFLLAVSPWHLQFSRPGFEASVALFFFVLALFLFFRAVNMKSSLVLTFSVLSFVLTLYSYNSARVVTPATISILATFYFRKFRFITWVRAMFVGLIVSLPFIFFSISPAGLARAKQISIFYQPTEFPIFQQFFLNYLVNVSPYYLFVKGDPTIAHATPHRMSLIYLFEFPFFILGLLVLIKAKTLNYLIIIFLFLIGFVPAALAMATPWYQPHALRALLVLPASVFISALGTGYFVRKLKSEKFVKVFVAVYLVIMGVSSLIFLDIYHNKYAVDSGWDWQVGIKRAVLRVKEIETNYDGVYFDQSVFPITALWYLKYDPRLYQLSEGKNNLGKYHFSVDSWQLIPGAQKNLYVTSANLPNGKLLESIYYPNGKIAYGIWEL